MLAPEYLHKCVNVLENDSSIVLSHSRTACIDEKGFVVGDYDNRTLNRLTSRKPHERFGNLISQRNTCWAIMGVIHAASLRKTALQGDYLDADRNLLAEIGLLGRIYEIPEHLFFRRIHSRSYTSTYYSKYVLAQDYRNQLAWWGGNKRRTWFVLPHWKNCLEFIKSVNRVHLKFNERLLCYREIGRWLVRGNGLRMMRNDLRNLFHLWRIKLITPSQKDKDPKNQ